MTKEKKKFKPVNSKEVCYGYNLLYKNNIVSFPLREDSEAIVGSVVANVNGSSFGVPHYETTPEKITAHLYFLIKNHPFIDGNKRTAVLTFFVLCKYNEIEPTLRKETGTMLDVVAVAISELVTDNHQLAIKTIAELLFAADNNS